MAPEAFHDDRILNLWGCDWRCDVANSAVQGAVGQRRTWWEIGKPWRLATADVDRCVDGVHWYVEEIDRMLDGRALLDGPISDIASWNYPMSVLHARDPGPDGGRHRGDRHDPPPTVKSPA